MKLYEWDFAPNCRRVRMFLLEKGIEVERQECITSDIILNNDYRGRYAHYMVPMLELDDGTQLGEALCDLALFRDAAARSAPDGDHAGRKGDDQRLGASRL